MRNLLTNITTLPLYVLAKQVLTCIKTNMLNIIYIFRHGVSGEVNCVTSWMSSPLCLCLMWCEFFFFWSSLKTKGAILACVHTNQLKKCVNADPNSRCTLQSCTLSARLETTSQFASHNVFFSARVYIRRTWPPACLPWLCSNKQPLSQFS